MTSWYDEFNSVFWTGIATMSFGALALLVKFCFASKCDNVNLCFGFIRVHRNVQIENEEEKTEIIENDEEKNDEEINDEEKKQN